MEGLRPGPMTSVSDGGDFCHSAWLKITAARSKSVAITAAHAEDRSVSVTDHIAPPQSSFTVRC